MKYNIRRTTQFKKDVKHLIGSGKDLDKLFFVIRELAEGRRLTSRYRDHTLKGKHKEIHDCHIEPNWILLYSIENDELVLYRTGSHARLFG